MIVFGNRLPVQDNARLQAQSPLNKSTTRHISNGRNYSTAQLGARYAQLDRS